MLTHDVPEVGLAIQEKRIKSINEAVEEYHYQQRYGTTVMDETKLSKTQLRKRKRQMFAAKARRPKEYTTINDDNDENSFHFPSLKKLPRRGYRIQNKSTFLKRYLARAVEFLRNR
jgi:hypothetical protein